MASWEVHGKGSLRQGSGEGKGDKVEVGDVHTARLLWIFDGSVPWAQYNHLEKSLCSFKPKPHCWESKDCLTHAYVH